MKAEELFVGALVRVNRDGLCIKKDTIVEVRAVDADDKLIEKRLIGSAHCRPLDDNQFEGGIWCEYLYPLPLTPEILEKNEFRKLVTYGTEKWIYGDIRMNIYSSNGCWRFCADTKRNENSVIYIHFVHELQNALRLCGIEKEIEL